MKPPKDALKKIKQYCESTNCTKCNYGQVHYHNQIICTLLEILPVYWETGEENEQTNSS